MVVWVAGVAASLVRGDGAVLDSPGVVSHLGHVGNIIAAPAARFDAVWYLAIAEHGYGAASANFFPLYPLSVRALGFVIRSDVVGGVIVSLLAFVAALAVLYRLVEMDYGPPAALCAVWLLALLPTSLFFSAIYTESLFLALSLGSFYAARRRSWAVAGLLGGLAAATRNVGVLLIAPLVIIYLQQHREQRRSKHPAVGRAATLRPLAAIALVPLGLIAYILGSAISRGSPFAMFKSGPADRGFALVPVTVVRQVEWTVAGTHGRGVVELAFLALATVAAVGVFRRLGRAALAYVVLSLLVLLSEPKLGGDPLFSFPRYILVIFPLWIWAALVLTEHRRARVPLLVASAILLATFSAQFATWRFVG